MPLQHTSFGARQSHEELQELYERYRRSLREFFVLRGDLQQADDLTQQMFLDLTRRPPPAQLRDAQGYLFRVAWNALRALHRRERSKPGGISISDPESLEEQTRRFGGLRIEDDATTLIAQESFTKILQQLPRVIQVSVLRHFRDGWTYRQISEELRCTTHAVKKYISRGLLHFRAQLAQSDTSKDGRHG
jgi:RNA polymerase sigma factor (sigma-70 family)